MGPAARVVARPLPQVAPVAQAAPCTTCVSALARPGHGPAQPVGCMPGRSVCICRHHARSSPLPAIHQARQPGTCAGCQGRQQFTPSGNTHQQPWHVGMAVTLRSSDCCGAARAWSAQRERWSACTKRAAIGRWRCLQGVRPACAARSPARATGPESSDQQRAPYRRSPEPGTTTTR